MNIANPLFTSQVRFVRTLNPQHTRTRLQSMVKQERRAVDQGPGDVLGGGQPPVGQLLGALLTSPRS